MKLRHEDLRWCLRLLPKPVFELLKERPKKLAVAGGFIRSAITGEKISDIDLFSESKDAAEAAARKLAVGRSRIETDNAYIVFGNLKYTVQFIHRWAYDCPEDILPSFDFTIARAAFWYDDEKWLTLCDEDFYSDLAAKRLVYCCPDRNEDAGGSMLRVLKFYQKGYRIPLDSLGSVIARLVSGVKLDEITAHEETELQMAKVLTGLLREVDPNIDPTHVAHMPAKDDENIVNE